MQIRCKEDVDKFFDKFQDPAYEVEQISLMVNFFYYALPQILTLDAIEELKQYFLKKLIMKAYRLGREHAYADTVTTIRDGGFIKREGS